MALATAEAICIYRVVQVGANHLSSLNLAPDGETMPVEGDVDMVDYSKPIPEDRPLTSEERELVRWLLEHGSLRSGSRDFLTQLDQARVVSRCPCGCASIEFSINGQIPPVGEPLEVLSDYEWDAESGAKFGVFVFVKAGLLAGLEVWSIDGLQAADKLPKPELLKPIEWTKKA
jgi:hypothetical protein